MKNWKVVLIIGFIVIFLFSGCTDEYAGGPEIEWLSHSGKTTMTYSYSGGVVSGVSLYAYFTVTEKSGELKIEASSSGSSKSCVTAVTEGEDYTVKVTCGLGTEGSSSKVLLDGPSIDSPFTISVSGYSVNVSGITCY